MIKNPFRNKAMRAHFDACVEAYRTKGERFNGNSMANYFWRGFNGSDSAIWDRQDRTTVAYAHYRAGQACAAMKAKGI